MNQLFKKLTGTAVLTIAALLFTNYAQADGGSGAAIKGTFVGGTILAIGGAAAAIAVRRSRSGNDTTLDNAINTAESEESLPNLASTGGDSNPTVAELDAGSAEIGEATDSVAEATTSAGNALRNVTAVGGDGVDVPGEADAGDLSDLVE